MGTGRHTWCSVSLTTWRSEFCGHASVLVVAPTWLRKLIRASWLTEKLWGLRLRLSGRLVDCGGSTEKQRTRRANASKCNRLALSMGWEYLRRRFLPIKISEALGKHHQSPQLSLECCPIQVEIDGRAEAKCDPSFYPLSEANLPADT